MIDVAVLGGGFAGLAAARRSAELGLSSHVLEASPEPGGMASSLDLGRVRVDRAYHYVKADDRHLLEMLAELGLTRDLVWTRTRMAFLASGRLYAFSSPLDLLRFRPLRFRDRLRFGLGVMRVPHTNSDALDGLDARSWIEREWSPEIHQRMLGPMLENKFGIAPERVSAAFLHGRIKGLASTKSSWRGGERLACLRSSTAILTEALAAEVRRVAAIQCSTPVRAVRRTGRGFTVCAGDLELEARAVVCTLALPVLKRLDTNLSLNAPISYQGVACAVFRTARPLTSFYWINVTDPELPFKVVVAHSNLSRQPESLVYCSRYVHASDPFFALPEEEILARYAAGLETIFGSVEILDASLLRLPHATPIFDRDFARHLSELEGREPGFRFAGNLKIYPGNRTISNVIWSGQSAAEATAAELRSA